MDWPTFSNKFSTAFEMCTLLEYLLFESYLYLHHLCDLIFSAKCLSKFMLHSMLFEDMFIQLHVRFKHCVTETALIICSVKMFDLNVVLSSLSGRTFLFAEGADKFAS